VHYQKVVVGRDYGAEIEINSGLAGAEALISNLTDNIAEATLVQVLDHQQ
jgi:hypothetical protein